MKINYYRFPGTDLLPSLSPFCMKLETYFALAKIEVSSMSGNPLKAPKGKLPYIDLDGERIGDSQVIIEALESRRSQALDEGLSADLVAKSHLVRKAFEESFYFAVVYSRWQDPTGWEYMAPMVQASLPKLLKGPLSAVFRKKTIKALHAQGIGRHEPSLVYEMAAEDLDAFAATLGKKAFFLGDRPRTVDACAGGFLRNVLDGPGDSPIARHLRSHENLIAYCQRIQEFE